MGILRHILLALIMALASPLIAQTYFGNGTAKYIGGDCYQLTSATTWENGSVWYADKIDLQNDFDLEFYMNFGNRDQGADGIVFVLQNKGNQALGQSGGGLGYEGFAPSLGVEFDDFQNVDINDPVADHIGVFRNGNINHISSNSLHQPVSALPNGANIEDGKDHLVRITWDARNTLLEVYFDCQKRISLTYDIDQNVFGGIRYVYWGFTSATGGQYNNQTVCLPKDIISSDTVEICLGDGKMLNSRKSIDDTYKWWPAIDLSDSTIKRPVCTPTETRTYFVEYTDRCDNKGVDTVEVLVDQPFTMDEVHDTLLCDGEFYRVNLSLDYDSARWNDGYQLATRILRKEGYYKFRAWKGVCWDDDSLTIEVDTIPKLQIMGDSFFCEGESRVLEVISIPTSASYYWHDGSTGNSIVVDQTTIATVNSSNRCGEAIASYKVREIILPDLEIEGDTLYCEGNELELDATNSWGYDVVWQDSSIGTSIMADSGRYIAQISDQDCYASDSHWVSYRPIPEASLSPIPLLCEYEPLILSFNQNNTKTVWSLGHSEDTADYTLASGYHWLKVFNECGIDSVPFFIERKFCSCDIQVPNAFSPNGDQLNDNFNVLPFCDKLQSYNIKIYSMWGEELYESSDLEDSWDGFYKDSPAQNGTYIYVITYSGIEGPYTISRTLKGVIHLVR